MKWTNSMEKQNKEFDQTNFMKTKMEVFEALPQDLNVKGLLASRKLPISVYPWTMNIANTGGSLVLLLIFIMAGFIFPKTQIPKWWEWSYWVSLLSYGYRAFAINEFFAPRWMNRMSSDNVTPLGRAVLQSVDIPTETSWYWYGATSLLGFAVLFNVLFTFALMYFDGLGLLPHLLELFTKSIVMAKKEFVVKGLK